MVLGKGLEGMRKNADYLAGVYNDIASIPLSISESKFTKPPIDFKLGQNYPNPFNPQTVIGYQLPVSSDVELSIYNILGQKVTTLVSEMQKAGYYKVEWDASGFASGVYIYKIKAGDYTYARKMMLLR